MAWLNSGRFAFPLHLFISRIDYCNALLAGVSKTTLSKLQSVQNSAARILTGTKTSEHISPVLESLHWLPVRFRIDFKILMLTYKALHGLAPHYLSQLLSVYTPVVIYVPLILVF